MPYRLSRMVILFAGLLMLSACGPELMQADVTRFNSLAAAAGRGFTILPDETQRGSLEFESYAQLVARELESRGWTPVAATVGAQPDTVVLLHWGSGQPRTETWSSPASVSAGGGWGPRHGYGGFGWSDPFPAYETRSVTYFPKWLTVDIVEGAAWRAGTTRKLFEGRAVSDSGGQAIAPVVPYLVRAMFNNFPGANGQTVRVSIPMGQ